MQCVSANYDQILVKFYRGMESGARTNQPDFACDPVQDPDAGLLSLNPYLNPDQDVCG